MYRDTGQSSDSGAQAATYTYEDGPMRARHSSCEQGGHYAPQGAYVPARLMSQQMIKRRGLIMTDERMEQIIARARKGYRQWEAEQAARPWWRKALDALKGRWA